MVKPFLYKAIFSDSVKYFKRLKFNLIFKFRVNYCFYKPIDSVYFEPPENTRFNENDFEGTSSKKLKNARQISLSDGNLAHKNDENIFPKAINNLNSTFNSMHQSHVISSLELN